MTYELMVLSTTPKTESEAKKVFASVETILKSLKVSDIKQDYWGKRDLAYEIKADTTGFYTVFTFTLSESSLGELTAQINLIEDITRYLLTKREESKVKKSSK